MRLKSFTQSLLFVLCIFAMATTANAQTIFEEDFSSEQDFFADWTTGGTNGGNQDWVWLDDPSFINFGAQPDFGSTTASNGYIMFNSDANGNFSHDVTVTSPAFDCTGEDVVWVTAENQYAFFSAATISIAELGVSTNGTDFTYYPIHTNVEQNNLSAAVDPVAVNISEVAANESEVYLQFRWQGFFEYTWKIDDVMVVNFDPRPDNDLQVNTFAAVAPNATIPASQVGAFGFIADIQNVGSQTQPNSTLTITINDGNSDVFTDELTYASIAPDSTLENVFFENEFTPEPVPGTTYTGTYTLALNDGVLDENLDNNTESFSFVVSDTLFAKDPGTGLYGTQPLDDTNYRFGCIYYVPNGSGREARTVSFLLGNPDDLAGETVTTFLYEWDGIGGEDFQLNAAELGDPIAFNFYTITGNESGITTLPVSFDDGYVPMNDDRYYVVVVEFSPSDSDLDNFLAVSSDIDYAAMNFYQDSLDNKDQYVVALDVGNVDEYSLVGFGFDVVPVVRLSITGTETANNNILLPTNSLNVYPTLADQEVWAEINLEEQKEVLDITIISANGTIIENRQLKNTRQEKLMLNVNQLPAGHYSIRLSTDEGVRSKPFIIQR